MSAPSGVQREKNLASGERPRNVDHFTHVQGVSFLSRTVILERSEESPDSECHFLSVQRPSKKAKGALSSLAAQDVLALDAEPKSDRAKAS